jgi:hypothetical protein
MLDEIPFVAAASSLLLLLLPASALSDTPD